MSGRPQRVLLLAIDPFSVGGIARYTRYVIRALTELDSPGDVVVCSLTPAAEDSLGGLGVSTPIVGSGRSWWAKGRFAIAAVWWSFRNRPRAIICDCVNLAPLAFACSRVASVSYWLNVYAIDVWGELSLARRFGLNHAGLVASDCQFTLDYLVAKYPTMTANTRVIEDCVDVVRFSPGTADPARFPVLGKKTGPFVMTISRLPTGRSKGHELVMRSMASLRKSNVEFVYLIGGDGPGRGRLEALSMELGLEDVVVFLGRISEVDLAEAYRLGSIFVLASSFDLEGGQGEGIPLALLEAQATGRPVISTRAGGSAECVLEGETGLLVDADDEAAMVAALRTLLGNEEARIRMGDNARNYAAANFSFEVFRSRISQALMAVGAR